MKDNITEIKLAMRCAEVFQRVREYKDKAKYNSNYVQYYISQLKLYYGLKSKIQNEQILNHLGELEKRVL